MKPFAGSALKNLLDSFNYAAEFLDRLPFNVKNAAIFGETAVQVVREYYLYRKGKFLTGGVGDAIAELGLPFSPEEAGLLMAIEKAMRMEEDYLEMIRDLEPENVRKLAQKLRETLK